MVTSSGCAQVTSAKLVMVAVTDAIVDINSALCSNVANKIYDKSRPQRMTRVPIPSFDLQIGSAAPAPLRGQSAEHWYTNPLALTLLGFMLLGLIGVVYRRRSRKAIGIQSPRPSVGS